MRNLLVCLSIAVIFSSCSSLPSPGVRLERANVLPLELNNAFEFRKAILYFHNANPQVTTQSETVQYQRQRMEFGALNGTDRNERYGNYYTFFWRTSERANVTVRLEYRQAGLGNYVKAQERYYPDARGSFKTDFAVIGDEYMESGRVTAWRAILIVEGRIVALKQSFMWR